MADEETKPSEEETPKEGEGQAQPGSSTGNGEGEDKGSTEGEKPKEEEPKVPLSRLRQERQKYETQLKDLQRTRTGVESPSEEGRKDDDETRIRGVLDKVKKEEEAETKKAEDEFNRHMEDLKIADPTVDEKSIVDIIKNYNVNDVDSAYKLYLTLQKGKTSSSQEKPKSPSGVKTTDEVQKEPFDTSKFKDLNSVREQVRRESGV